MPLYEVWVRLEMEGTIEADSPEEAKKVFEDFMDREAEYLQEELDLNGNKEWEWGPFEVCNPALWDERATITKNEDGSFDAQYEGGNND